MGWITDFNADKDSIVIGGVRIKVKVDPSMKPNSIKFVNPYDKSSVTFENIKVPEGKKEE